MTTETVPFEINWNMSVLRASIIKQLSKQQIEELHRIEDRTAENFIKDMKDTYRKDNPDVDNQEFYERTHLLMPFNIQQLFFKNVEMPKDIDKREKGTIIMLIAEQIPKGIEVDITHYTSVKWQHGWDWSIFHSKGFDGKKDKTDWRNK